MHHLLKRGTKSVFRSLCAPTEAGQSGWSKSTSLRMYLFFCLLRPFFYSRWTCFHLINLNKRGLCVSATMHKAEVRLDSSAVSKRLAASGSCTKSWRSCRRTCVAGADSSAVCKTSSCFWVKEKTKRSSDSGHKYLSACSESIEEQVLIVLE